MQVISSTIALEMLSQVIEEPLKTVSKKVDASAYRAISAMSPEEQNDLIEFVRKEFRLDEAPQGE